MTQRLFFPQSFITLIEEKMQHGLLLPDGYNPAYHQCFSKMYLFTQVNNSLVNFILLFENDKNKLFELFLFLLKHFRSQEIRVKHELSEEELKQLFFTEKEGEDTSLYWKRFEQQETTIEMNLSSLQELTEYTLFDVFQKMCQDIYLKVQAIGFLKENLGDIHFDILNDVFVIQPEFVSTSEYHDCLQSACHDFLHYEVPMKMGLFFHHALQECNY